MKTKERLYAVIGGCAGAILAMAVTSFFPLGVQSQSDTFGEISCTGLEVVDADGKAVIMLHPGFIGEAGVQIRSRGKVGTLTLSGISIDLSTSRGLATLDGDSLHIFGGGKSVSVLIDEHGGAFRVTAKGEEPGAVEIGVTNRGGRVDVYGKGPNRKSRVVLSVNEYGNGAIGTWDKDGCHTK